MSAEEKYNREEILTRPAKDRLEYFDGLTVGHPRLKVAFDELLQAIHQSGKASIIYVTGPTGVGKTTLLRRTVQELIRAAMPEMEQDPGKYPVVHMEAVAPDSRSFSWRDFYRRALRVLDEPLIDYKTIDPQIKYRLGEGNRISRMDQGKVGSQKLLDQMDCIKSLASQTGVPHVLFGTYELLLFRNLSGQLSRRSLDVHFPRYRADIKEDLQAFKSVIRYFQKRLPLKEEPDVGSMWEFLYEQTVGCIGILKDLIHRALAVALAEENPTLTAKHLERHALSLSQCEQIMRDIVENENEFMESQARRKAYWQALGLEERELPKEEQAMPQPVRKYGSVGKRNPTRDPVGRVESGG